MHPIPSYVYAPFVLIMSYLVGVSRKDLQEYMNKDVKDLLNKQITNELESAYLYLEFSNFFDSRNLDGYANYYRVQAKEEIDHGMLIYDYLHKCNENVKLMVINAPNEEYTSIEDVLDAGLEAEKRVTSMINTIYESTIRNSDYASKTFIKWFIDEQVEEESSAQNMIDEYKLYKNNLLQLNQKYLERKHERVKRN